MAAKAVNYQLRLLACAYPRATLTRPGDRSAASARPIAVADADLSFLIGDDNLHFAYLPTLADSVAFTPMALTQRVFLENIAVILPIRIRFAVSICGIIIGRVSRRVVCKHD